MNINVEEKFIEGLMKSKADVEIHTTDGRKIICQIDDVDERTILVRLSKRKRTPESKLIYKHDISSICYAR